MSVTRIPVSSDSSPARAETRFRQLCSLGVGGLVNAPAILTELSKVLPASSAVIFHERAGGLVGVYQEASAPGAAKPATHERKTAPLSARREPDGPAPRPLRFFMRDELAPRPVLDALHASWYDELHPDLYQMFFRPADPRRVLRLRFSDRSGTIGMVGVCRGPQDQGPEVCEVDTLRRLEPFIAQALQPRQTPGIAEVENGHSALMIVDARGRERWATVCARTMFTLALGSLDAGLPAGALRLVQELLATTADDSKLRSPAWSCRSRWGSFRFRAYRLESATPGDALAGITVTRLVPLPLRLFEVLGEIEISPRQAEIALHMALGKSQERVASDLHLSRATVVYHRRQIYNRLEVNTREELLDRLLHSHREAGPDERGVSYPAGWGNVR